VADFHRIPKKTWMRLFKTEMKWEKKKGNQIFKKLCQDPTFWKRKIMACLFELQLCIKLLQAFAARKLAL
jgi:hypothetical protein